MASVRGFTLVEALVALALMAFGALAILSMQGTSIGFSRSAEIRSQAASMAAAGVDVLRSDRPAAISGKYDTDFGDKSKGTCGASDASPAEALACWQGMLATNLPQGRGRIAVEDISGSSTFSNAPGGTPVTPYRVRVAVRWGNGSDPDGERTVEVVSEL